MMNRSIWLFLLLALVFALPAAAQEAPSVEAESEEIGDNLDLEAIASAFGEAEDLEDFEKQLNDPDAQLTNLDLNGDGEVDYLRVMETVEDETHVVAVQAVLAEDQYQDVATIEVEKDDSGEPQVQVVGDVYLYGPHYYCSPVYVRPPPLLVIFWGPIYRPWRSPWYWGYYPPYYHPWRPYPVHTYRTNVHVRINVNNTYNFTSVRKSSTAARLQQNNRRNDFERQHPEMSFAKRNPGVENRRQLNGGAMPATVKDRSDLRSGEKTTGQKVRDDWKPGAAGERAGEGVGVAPKAGDKKPDAKPESKTDPKTKKLPQKPADGKSLPKKKPKKRPRRG
jgi:hypothetical protein